mmetsp:Transcript_13368/g.28924  ORF Transcript_13368/g.28924 Transcript_13368/m.28924 type:complete len:106 (-) Transcript_13368:285-602(-)
MQQLHEARRRELTIQLNMGDRGLQAMYLGRWQQQRQNRRVRGGMLQRSKGPARCRKKKAATVSMNNNFFRTFSSTFETWWCKSTPPYRGEYFESVRPCHISEGKT